LLLIFALRHSQPLIAKRALVVTPRQPTHALQQFPLFRNFKVRAVIVNTPISPGEVVGED